MHARLPSLTRFSNVYLRNRGFDVVEKVNNRDGAGIVFAKKNPWIKWSSRVDIKRAKENGYYDKWQEKVRLAGHSREPTLSDEGSDWDEYEDDGEERYDWEK
ncbi:hypothetical protein L198_01361 [Cryptococcus wingfieldii CBS 7118]|uniref:Uncharacterized protein n=1 Tax=Cryptococcus wingfieldii CBS 7118 TaxID=1295528 RepID=A0A1E3JZ81_9TREE|nr:hypothetical protein L198_01361 [Cryptococcus wingfieldii CBS 7118]ODO06129.1 hypothetical protein L198_01361 [Cryptococcus wingfieldii CBS 7118]